MCKFQKAYMKNKKNPKIGPLNDLYAHSFLFVHICTPHFFFKIAQNFRKCSESHKNVIEIKIDLPLQFFL